MSVVVAPVNQPGLRQAAGRIEPGQPLPTFLRPQTIEVRVLRGDAAELCTGNPDDTLEVPGPEGRPLYIRRAQLDAMWAVLDEDDA